MTRKVIQISASTVSNSGYLRGEVVTVLTALCNDGTVWWRIKGDGAPSAWSLVDDVPQPEPVTGDIDETSRIPNRGRWVD